jgi:hypothetical protein
MKVACFIAQTLKGELVPVQAAAELQPLIDAARAARDAGAVKVDGKSVKVARVAVLCSWRPAPVLDQRAVQPEFKPK